ncbi:hypothetical protein ABNX05_19200 [Lysinibacillus sp. M3]|uniref:Uncharacterized protein n=1 Tax=Lysinibacillus zambalensis TaxID=3160866 RepID=A0ABV1MW82_9BACI
MLSLFYQQSSIPYALPAVLVDNVVAVLQAYPERYGQLQQRFNFFQQVFKNPLKEVKAFGRMSRNRKGVRKGC